MQAVMRMRSGRSMLLARPQLASTLSWKSGLASGECTNALISIKTSLDTDIIPAFDGVYFFQVPKVLHCQLAHSHRATTRHAVGSDQALVQEVFRGEKEAPARRKGQRERPAESQPPEANLGARV
ncbi:uncharacterized protein BDV14DRAFT_86778 [Aspergillus stella-maris]|uniref:uncharacterized protein n=1 Tax=Aspergillus stella-maris TaxID=1810926 RepID=UPI003CCDC8E9